MARSSLRLAALAPLSALALACADPTAPVAGDLAVPLGPIQGNSLQMLTCRVTVATGAMSCTDALPPSAASRLILGGQNQYVVLAGTNAQTAGGTFSLDVTVQNLIPQALGTNDGTTTDNAGVSVFFQQLPTVTGGSGTVAVQNADGTGLFTAAGQPYFQYLTQLGADKVLSTNETSSARSWSFTMDAGVTSFTFSVYVSANVAHPMGYVDVTADSTTMAMGGTGQLTATVRTAVGNAAADQSVSWTTSDAAVATVNGTGLLTAVGVGHATLSATKDTLVTSRVAYVCPNLVVGAAFTFPSAEQAAFCVSGATSAAEYTMMPVNQSSTARTNVTVLGTGIGAVTGPPSPDRLTPTATVFAKIADDEMEVRAQFEAAMHERELRELPPLSVVRTHPARGRGAASSRVPSQNPDEASELPGAEPDTPADAKDAATTDAREDPLLDAMRQYASERPTSRGTRRSRLGASGASRTITPNVVPVVGSLMDLNTNSACSGSPSVRTGQVRSVTQHLVIVADTTNPAGGFTTAQYDSIALEFDTLAWPVDSAAFGAPTDVDGNGHVIAFFTRAVNELSPPASSAVVLGFFASKDVYSADPVNGCSNSNEGEMFYMLVPDPTGAVNSNVRTVSFVRGNTTGTLGHEFQHQINAFRRGYVTGASFFEQGFLNEGLSHIAEELMFYKASGMSPRVNIQLGTNATNGVQASAKRVAAFNAYANPNYGRLKGWLNRPDTTGAFKNNANSLAVRGAIWAFLRYSADRLNGNENAFWYSLVNSNLEGTANIGNAIGGVNPQDWLRDFTTAMYADDAGLNAAAIYTQPSWNFRSLYGALNGSYQLVPRALTNNTALTLTYSGGGGAAYTRFSVPAATSATFSVLTGGVPVVSLFPVTLLRTK